jgi:hypothetical protein
MSDRPNFLSVPKLIFLLNGRPLESAALASAIVREVPQGAVEFFSEPLTSGIVGLFYGDQPFDGYVAFDTPTELCRNSRHTLQENRASLRLWLEEREGQEVLGRLARDRVESSFELFSHFIFPDADHGTEIVPLVKRFPHQSLLILAPGMNVPTALTDGPFETLFATPHETLAKLALRNEKESAA